MKYFWIIDKNVAAIFQLQWKIGNISDMFLQYSVLCGLFKIIVERIQIFQVTQGTGFNILIRNYL